MHEMQKNVVITCAVTGNLTTPEMTPHLPITPELFDSGDVALCHDLLADGTLQGPILCSIVMGVKYGFQPSPETMLYARSLLPPGAVWTAFGTGRMAFPMVAQ